MIALGRKMKKLANAMVNHGPTWKQTLAGLSVGALLAAANTARRRGGLRSDITDATVKSLAQQGQFAGVGIVSPGGTGVAIAPGWVMTARHVVGDGERSTFFLNGQSYNGTSVEPGR